jgi:hypothetical protein
MVTDPYGDNAVQCMPGRANRAPQAAPQERPAPEPAWEPEPVGCPYCALRGVPDCGRENIPVSQWDRVLAERPPRW